MVRVPRAELRDSSTSDLVSQNGERENHPDILLPTGVPRKAENGNWQANTYTRASKRQKRKASPLPRYPRILGVP